MFKSKFVFNRRGLSSSLRLENWIPAFAGMTLTFFLLLQPALAVSSADFYQVNQSVCDRFEEDTVRLSAIMEEIRRRQGITETRVAYGNVDTPIERADYWVTYAAEAIAFQRAKKYSSKASLKSDLVVLQNKIIRAKGEVKKVL